MDSNLLIVLVNKKTIVLHIELMYTCGAVPVGDGPELLLQNKRFTRSTDETSSLFSCP